MLLPLCALSLGSLGHLASLLHRGGAVASLGQTCDWWPVLTQHGHASVQPRTTHLQSSLKRGAPFLRPLSREGFKRQSGLYSGAAQCQERQGEKSPLAPPLWSVPGPCPAHACRCVLREPARGAVLGAAPAPHPFRRPQLQSFRKAPEERN